MALRGETTSVPAAETTGRHKQKEIISVKHVVVFSTMQSVHPPSWIHGVQMGFLKVDSSYL